jgi:hypothetical protein
MIAQIDKDIGRRDGSKEAASGDRRRPTRVVQLACRSLRERSSPPTNDVQHEADDRENNQDVDRGGRNVKEAESRDPGDTKNDSKQKQH